MRATLVCVTVVATRPAGTDGANVSWMGSDTVVTDSALDAEEVFPATSLARTVYEYAVLGARPVSVNVLDVVEPIFVPSRYTSYPARPDPPVSSVDADQDTETLLLVTPLAASPVGTLGAVVSVGVALVVTDRADDAAEMFPATSLARTVYEYAVEAVRPVSENDVVVEEPTFVVPR